MSAQAPATDPIAETANPAGDYELSIKVDFAVFDYTDGIGRQRIVEGSYSLFGGRQGDAWHWGVSPIVGSELNAAGESEDAYGEPVLELRGQTADADPLALLRALLSGGTA
jgi:hypothetical protein